MEITLILKGATPAEVREALRELYDQGTPGEPMEAQPYEIEDSVVGNVLKNGKKKSYHKWTPGEDKDIIELRDKYGRGPTEIANILHDKYGFRVTRESVKSRQYLLDGRREINH